MHERVWGRRGPRGGIEGGPGPRTSLAHGGRRQSEGRGPPAPGPGPAPGPALQSSTASAAVAAAALWSQPRLVPAEGRRAAAPPGPLALSGRRLRGGACGSPASPLSRVLHGSSRHSERGAPRTWLPLSEGLGLGAGQRDGRSGERPGHLPDAADTLRAQTGWSPLSGQVAEAHCCGRRLGAPVPAAPRPRFPHLRGGLPLPFPVGVPPWWSSRPLAAVLRVAALGVRACRAARVTVTRALASLDA